MNGAPTHIKNAWLVEPFDLVDIADQLRKIVDAREQTAYSAGKGREAHAMQSFDAMAFLSRWFRPEESF